jgi:ketosteroid isomerase-like protein
MRILILILALAAAAGAQTNESRDALVRKLADTERAFARTSVEHGPSLAFYEFFAEEGITLQPQPQRPRAEKPTEKDTFAMDWKPLFSDVSQAGDLGISSGPWELTPDGAKEPQVFGYFVSIWRRQPNGQYRVIHDLGTRTDPFDAAQRLLAWKPAAASAYRAKQPVDVRLETIVLNQLDARFAASLADGNIAEIYAQYLADDARVYRVRSYPRTTQPEIDAYLRQAGQDKVKLTPIQASMAASADLAYAWGELAVTPKEGPARTGYYTHVWKRNASGEWKLSIDVWSLTPLPQPAPK